MSKQEDIAFSPPTISIVCCTHNREAFASAHFEAMRVHLHEDIELLYALDNCTDATLTTLQSLTNGHPKVRVLEHKGERGLFNCRNFGIAHARGAYIHFLDDDDCVEPGFYSSLLGHLNGHGHHDIDIYLSRLRVISDKDGEYLRQVFSPAAKRLSTTREGLQSISGDLFELFLSGDIYYVPANAVLSTELLRRYPFHSTLKKSADWLFILEASLKQSLSIALCTAATANYVVHAASMSTKPDKVLWNLQVFELLLEMAKSKPDRLRAVERNCALANFHAGYALRLTDRKRSRLLYWRSFKLHARAQPLLAIAKTFIKR